MRWMTTMIMGWLRSVGSLKLSVSFAEYRLFYKALLQKRRIILRSLRIVVTRGQRLPNNGEITLWVSSTNQSIVHILVLVGSHSSFTETTEYKFIFLIMASSE